MNQEEYLFLPEAKMIDKLMSVFTIQSKPQLAPNELIGILGLVNLLNIVSVASEASSGNSLDTLLTKAQGLNNQQLQQSLQQLGNNTNQQDNLINSLTKALNQNSGSNNNPLMGLLQGFNNNSNSQSEIDPTLILKLMNLVNQFKGNKSKDNHQEDEDNQPVKTEPYDQEEE